MTIRHLQHKQIDPLKWDGAIFRSRVPQAYALFGYLNKITDNHWSALVYGDYEAVFPLPLKQKFGITYVVQPIFCQQLGAFGTCTNVSTMDFVNAIPKHFVRVRMNLNPYFDKQNKPVLTVKTNLVLPLSSQPDYNKDCRKNLLGLQKYPIQFEENKISIHDAVGVYRQAWGNSNLQLALNDYNRFVGACETLQESHNGVLTIAATNTETNELLGAAIILRLTNLDQHQIQLLQYVCAGPTAEGKPMGIMHGIIDAAIQKHLGPNTVFDFEGSSIPSVAAFYKKFGPEDNPYYLFKRGL